MRSTKGQLAGVRILIVEDDFFLAIDEQSALEGAGAHVVGPFADEDAGVAAVAAGLDCAVLDLNLGDGPSFAVAVALRAKNIPFLFVTGYNVGAIPPEFRDVNRVQKPVVMRDLVRAVQEIAAKPARP